MILSKITNDIAYFTVWIIKYNFPTVTSDLSIFYHIIIYELRIEQLMSHLREECTLKETLP